MPSRKSSKRSNKRKGKKSGRGKLHTKDGNDTPQLQQAKEEPNSVLNQLLDRLSLDDKGEECTHGCPKSAAKRGLASDASSRNTTDN